MFWPFKKRETKPQPPPTLFKFQRGDKVRDIYDGPVMFVDNPRELQLASVWQSIVTRVSVKCVRWNSDEEYKIMLYSENELVLVERKAG